MRKGVACGQRTRHRAVFQKTRERKRKKRKRRKRRGLVAQMSCNNSNNDNKVILKNKMHTHSLALTCLQSPTDLREELLHTLTALG